MTTKEWAERLSGREYLKEMTKPEEVAAGTDGMLILYGGSDDLIEFRGVIDDEQGAYNGGTYKLTRECEAIRIGKNGLGRDFAADDVRKRIETLPEIRAIWSPVDNNEEAFASWEIQTEIPHETFDIMEDGELFCRGAVIAWADVFPTQNAKPYTAPNAIESGMCCEYCLKQETSECPVKTASPWSRWGNYCNEYVRKEGGK